MGKARRKQAGGGVWLSHYEKTRSNNLTIRPFLRDVAIDADPDGKRRTIGQEWDLVLSIQHFNPFEINLIGSIFRAGSAYGSLSGETAYKVTLEVNLSF